MLYVQKFILSRGYQESWDIKLIENKLETHSKFIDWLRYSFKVELDFSWQYFSKVGKPIKNSLKSSISAEILPTRCGLIICNRIFPNEVEPVHVSVESFSIDDFRTQLCNYMWAHSRHVMKYSTHLFGLADCWSHFSLRTRYICSRRLFTSALIPLSKVETCPELDQIQSKSCWYSLRTCLGAVMLDGSPTRKRPSSTFGDCQTETLEANFLYLDSGQGEP